MLPIARGESAYAEPCRVLERLCPRPSPPQLRAARLSVLSVMDPELATELSGSPAARQLIESLRRLLAPPERGTRCSFCGKKAEAMAEVWDYIVTGSHGTAVLEAILPVCRSCSEALTNWERLAARDKKLIKHLAKVNKAKKDQVEAALVDIETVLERLAAITRWRFRLEALPPGGAREAGERLLERIAEEHPGVADGVLYYEHAGLLVEEHLARVKELVCSDPGAAAALSQLAREHGLEPSWSSIEEYLDLVRPLLCRARGSPAIHSAWILRLSSLRERARFFAAYVELLSSPKELVWAARVETPIRPSDTVYVYVQSFADPALAARVLKEAAEIARSIGAVFKGAPVLVPADPRGRGLWERWLYRAPEAASAP